MRIYLGGHGDPIPRIALPDPNLDSTLPILVLELADGEPFLKGDWTSFGYTNFEVWCIGAAGGRGGGMADRYYEYKSGGGGIQFFASKVPRIIPADQWALMHESGSLYDLDLSPPKNYYTDYYTTIFIPGNPNYPPGGVPGTDYGWPFTHYEAVEYYNPTHQGSVTTYRNPFLLPSGMAVGGGGGGGGVQAVSGLLSDLPDEVEVEIGQAGDDVGPGQTNIDGPLTPLPPVLYPYPVSPTDPWDINTWEGRWIRKQQIRNILDPQANVYPEPHPSFLPPQPGLDGGASTFGDICQASGGKGGYPSLKWVGGVLTRDGAGGAGGVGGSDIAGGGAAGGRIPSGSGIPGPGTDGTWDPSTRIGQGGGGGFGGGKGGTQALPTGGVYTIQKFTPTSGGRGAFSYADTSIYGARQPANFWSYTTYEIDNETGLFIEVEKVVVTSDLINPGGGGGARAMRKFYYGSHAQGYNPNGIVVIRLTKVE